MGLNLDAVGLCLPTWVVSVRIKLLDHQLVLENCLVSENSPETVIGEHVQSSNLEENLIAFPLSCE